MKKKYRYKLLRMKVRFRRLFKASKPTIEYDSPQQEKAIRIAERLIRDSDSELLMAPKIGQHEEKLYLRNKNIFVVISRRSVQIINGKYNYDIPIFDKLHEYISDKFKRKLELKRREMEDTITSKVETILDVIYKDIS